MFSQNLAELYRVPSMPWWNGVKTGECFCFFNFNAYVHLKITNRIWTIDLTYLCQLHQYQSLNNSTYLSVMINKYLNLANYIQQIANSSNAFLQRNNSCLPYTCPISYRSTKCISNGMTCFRIHINPLVSIHTRTLTRTRTHTHTHTHNNVHKLN